MRELDLGDLSARVAAAMAGAEVDACEPLAGGASSLTYSATVTTNGDRRRVVVKVAPPGLEPVRNRDVLRQARILDALAKVDDVAVPEVLATDEGDPPEIPPLFVMSHVEGDSIEPLITPDPPVTPETVRSRAMAAARMMAALHAVDVGAVGLGDEPLMALPDEVARWERAFSTVEDDLRVGADELHNRLVGGIPDEVGPAVLHGDYRLGNMLCDGSEVAALIDWEIWSIGDPRLDLAWFLLMADRDHPGVVSPDAGMPSSDELLAAYEGFTDVAVDDLAWFAALARYKQAATTALIVKNARKRGQGDALPGTFVALQAELNAWALRILDARPL